MATRGNKELTWAVDRGGRARSSGGGTVSQETTVSTSPEVEEVDLLVIGGGKAGKSLAMDRAR